MREMTPPRVRSEPSQPLGAERDTRFRRGITRDGEPYRREWERWAAQEAEQFLADRTRERADLIVNTTRWQ